MRAGNAATAQRYTDCGKLGEEICGITPLLLRGILDRRKAICSVNSGNAADARKVEMCASNKGIRLSRAF